MTQADFIPPDEPIMPPEILPQGVEIDVQDLAAPPTEYRAASSDPAFGMLLALALSIGLTPTLPDNADLRYTLAWGALAGVGVIAWLLGSTDRIQQEDPSNVAWGVGFGVLVSLPFLIFRTDTFATTSELIFPDMGLGTVLAFLVFVMPLAETLFFRGLLQRQTEMWRTGIFGWVWQLTLLLPVFWQEVLNVPAVAFFLAVALLTMNLMYSYVRERNGLAAAWICQIVANLMLFFLPLLQGNT